MELDLGFSVWGALPSGPRAELRVLRTRAGDDVLAAHGAGAPAATGASVASGASFPAGWHEAAWRRLRALDRGLSLAEWERSSGGAALAEAMGLLTAGLCCLRWTGGPADARLRPEDLAARLLCLDWDGLYTLLTHQAKLRLGLVAGFRMVLAIERCQRLAQLQALSLLFVDALWVARGEDGIRPVCERLVDRPMH